MDTPQKSSGRATSTAGHYLLQQITFCTKRRNLLGQGDREMDRLDAGSAHGIENRSNLSGFLA